MLVANQNVSKVPRAVDAYSITSSARASKVGGKSRPRVLAVLRLSRSMRTVLFDFLDPLVAQRTDRCGLKNTSMVTWRHSVAVMLERSPDGAVQGRQSGPDGASPVGIDALPEAH